VYDIVRAEATSSTLQKNERGRTIFRAEFSADERNTASYSKQFETKILFTNGKNMFTIIIGPLKTIEVQSRRHNFFLLAFRSFGQNDISQDEDVGKMKTEFLRFSTERFRPITKRVRVSIVYIFDFTLLVKRGKRPITGKLLISTLFPEFLIFLRSDDR